MQPPTAIPNGDYVKHYGQNTPENIATAKEIMRNNGCRSTRVDVNPDGSVTIHGFLVGQ